MAKEISNLSIPSLLNIDLFKHVRGSISSFALFKVLALYNQLGKQP
jgi:hypothetical protein